LWRRDYEAAHKRSTGAFDVAGEHDFQTWKALALALQGVALVGVGHSANGLQRVDEGIALYQGLKAPPVFWPLVHSIRSRAFALAGRPAEALDFIDQAIELAGSGNFLFPEFALLKGDLLLALEDAEGAEHWYRSALAGATGFGLRMPQLRAGVRLTRMSQASGTQREWIDVLYDAYGSFTEGFESRDLIEARAVLGEEGVVPRKPC